MRKVIIILTLLIINSSWKIISNPSIDVYNSFHKPPATCTTLKTCYSKVQIREDDSYEIVKRLYIEANRANLNNNFQLALELYGKFINLSSTTSYEKTFWKERRISLSYMSTINIKYLNYKKSINQLKKALEITLSFDPNDTVNCFSFLFNIAKDYYNESDYNKSIEYYNQAQAILNSSNELPAIHESQILNNLALCYFKLGNDEMAQKYLNKSIKIKINANNFEDLAKNYNNIGLILEKKTDYNQALIYFNKSLSVYDSIGNSAKSAFVNNNIGNLFLKKESFDTCKYYYEKSLNIRLKSQTTPKLDLIKSYNNLAYVYLKINQTDSSQFFNNIAKNLNIQSKDTDSISIISITDYLVSIADQIDINFKKYQLNNDTKILENSLTEFNSAVLKIIDHLIFYNSIFSANIFVNENRRLFDSTIMSAHILDSIQKNIFPTSLIISETFKSLTLLNQPSEFRNISFDTTTIDQTERLNKSFQWQQLLMSDSDSYTISNKLKLIDSLMRNTIECDSLKRIYSKILKKNINLYFENIKDSIIQYCSKLNDKILVDYYITNKSVLIHTISKSKISCKEIPISEDFANTVAKFSNSIVTLDNKNINLYGQTISKTILNPISTQISKYKYISFIPDTWLYEIPFESLPFQNNSQTDSKYLVESKNITYRFTVLRRNYSNRPNITNYSSDYLGIAPFDSIDIKSNNLGGAAKEINYITHLFNSRNLTASSLLGKDATYNNISAATLNSKILQISTHSIINEMDLQLSFLELSPTIGQIPLNLSILPGLPLHNELLLIDACETGKNLIDPTTGFFSFLRSILNISIENYICTLWKVYDEPTYNFIISFYGFLLNGNNYSDSLTFAKRKFLYSNQLNHPIFWSPFILYENN